MTLLTTEQASDRIGVSVRHVQRLIAGGDLVAIGPDRVDADSVARWMAQRQGSRPRAWEESTAWAAVALLEGEPALWLGPVTTVSSEGGTRGRHEYRARRPHPQPGSSPQLPRAPAGARSPGPGGHPVRCDSGSRRTQRRSGPDRRVRRPRRPCRAWSSAIAWRPTRPAASSCVTTGMPTARGDRARERTAARAGRVSTSPAPSTRGNARPVSASSTAPWSGCVTDGSPAAHTGRRLGPPVAGRRRAGRRRSGQRVDADRRADGPAARARRRPPGGPAHQRRRRPAARRDRSGRAVAGSSGPRRTGIPARRRASIPAPEPHTASFEAAPSSTS